jgi:hypothetical protein
MTPQHAHGNLSWFFRAHFVIMPVARLQSRI